MKKLLLTIQIIAALTAAGTGCAGNVTNPPDNGASVSDGGTSAPDSATSIADSETSSGAETDVQPAGAVTSDVKETAEAAEAGQASSVMVEFAEDSAATDFIEYVPEEPGEPEVSVVFSAEGTIRDFTLLALDGTIDDDGNVTYELTELYRLDELTPEKPLKAGMTFPGTVPNNGFSYVDGSGALHRCALNISGKDGSLITWEF